MGDRITHANLHIAISDDKEAMGKLVAAQFAKIASSSVQERGQFTVALTGGSAAQSFYRALTSLSVAWDRTHIFFGDERCVPPSHADSNYKLAHDVMLLEIPQAHIHRLHGESANLHAESMRAASEMAQVFGVDPAQIGKVMPAMDLFHVGMGPDGHICSLFEGHALLAVEDAWIRHLTDSPKPPPARLTMTMPVVAASRTLTFIVAGDNKADVVQEIMTSPTSQLPAAIAQRRALAQGNTVQWFLDKAAAQKL